VKIFITGSNGFIGKNVISYFFNKHIFNQYKRDDKICINDDAVLHLAGIAHDVKSVIDYSEYYNVNTEFTKKIYDAFLNSNAKVFIFLSSVKAAADEVVGILTEENSANPKTHYGKSKLLAENYILSKRVPQGKRVYILRPCMIHGPENKGNLNLLYQLVSKGFPWPLGAFNNERSFCSIENLMFVIGELIEREDINSGIYNVADDDTISTNDLISIIAKSLNRKSLILNVPIQVVRLVVRLLDHFHIINASEKLNKLTESYVVSNQKLSKIIGKPFPIDARDGLLTTFQFFKNK
jgi:nucleoside-diphosphate-sugar epimerase